MTKMWKVVYGIPAPVEVEAETPCWPHKDSTGEQIFENTHFCSIENAWMKHLSEHKAGFSLAACAVNDQREVLEDKEKRLVKASLAYDAAQRAHKEFVRGGM